MADTSGADPSAGKPFRKEDVYIAPAGDDFGDSLVERPGWPKTVGVISIIWGGLGLCCGVGQLAFSQLGGKLMQSAASNMQGGMPPALSTPDPMIMLATGVGMLWAILLIVAGSMTASRKSAGRTLHLLWAPVSMILACIGIYLSFRVQAKIHEWVQANPDADFSKSQAKGGAIGQIIGLVLGIFFGFAWPGFCLIWFGLVKRKPVDMTGGIEDAVI